MGSVWGLLVTLAILGFTSCTGATLDPDPPLDPGRPAYEVGTTLAQWDEGQFPALHDNPQIPNGHRLITTDAERDALIEATTGPNLSAVAAADLEQSVLVVAGYPSCQEQGAVYTNNDTVWFDVVIAPEDRGTLCAWSPFTAQVIEVPRETFHDEPALVTPPWG